MHRDAVFLNGRAAVQRTGGLHDVRLFTIDLVESNVAHHLQCAIPPELYERYYAVLMDVLKTYEPLWPAPRPAADDSPAHHGDRK
jgi:hypothetical protein